MTVSGAGASRADRPQRTAPRQPMDDLLGARFDALRIINLAERRDRRRAAARELESVGATPVFYAARRPQDAGGFPATGARGCFESHLGVLREAVDQRLQSILILEDDIAFAKDFRMRAPAVLALLHQENWSVFFGGYDPANPPKAAEAREALPRLQGRDEVRQTHFVALRGEAIAACAAYFEAILAQPAGWPGPGRIHVDGAYNHFWWEHPHFAAFVATPPLAVQRASRSDIADLQWFDRLPIVRDAADWARRALTQR